MNAPAIAAHVLLGLAAGYFLIFGVSSISEKQARAAILSFLFVLIILAVALLQFLFIDNSAFYSVEFVFLAVFIVLFFSPFGKTKSMQILPTQERVDERDTIFARSDLAPGTKNYEEYYSLRPENKKKDDRFRELPEIARPGGKYYERKKAASIEALFVLEEKLLPFVDGDFAPTKAEIPAPEASDLLKKKTIHYGAEEVGVAPIDERFIYSRVGRGPAKYGSKIETEHKFAIVFSVEMKLDAVDKAPLIDITEETALRYLDCQAISFALAEYIRTLGFAARAHVAGSDYQVVLPAAAHAAGLGEIGRMGYLISPKFGARVRLGCVTTDMPLVADEPIAFGVQNFCEICKKCAENCPSGSIPFDEKKLVRGAEKWKIDVEKCFTYWRYVGTDCGLCMKTCPFSREGSFAHDVLRFAVKHSAFARRLSLWGDKLFYGRKEKFNKPEIDL